MNALLILLLCSVTYCFASPTCSIDQELKKCGTKFPDVVDTEEKLEIYCETMGCWIEVYERCGFNEDKETRMAYLTYKRSFDGSCDKSNPIRQKLVRNLKCLNDVSKGEEMKQCRDDHKLSNHHDFCRSIMKSLECSYDIVFKKCGRDAKDAFEAVYPSAEMFGCP